MRDWSGECRDRVLTNARQSNEEAPVPWPMGWKSALPAWAKPQGLAREWCDVKAELLFQAAHIRQPAPYPTDAAGTKPCVLRQAESTSL